MKKPSISILLVFAMLAAMFSGLVPMAAAQETPDVDFVRADSIEAGSIIMFVYPDAASPKAAGPIAGNEDKTFLSSVDAILTDTSVVADQALVFEVEAGTEEGSYAFKNNGKYLSCSTAASGSNYVFLTQTEKSADTDWFVSFDEDCNAIITHELPNDVTRYLQYNVSSPRFSSYVNGSQKSIAIYKQSRTETPEDIDIYFVDGTDTETPYFFCYDSRAVVVPGATSENLSYPGDPQIAPVGKEMNAHNFYKITLSPESVDMIMFGCGGGQFSETATADHTAALSFADDAVTPPEELGGNRFVVYEVNLQDGVLAAVPVNDVWPEYAMEIEEPNCTEPGGKVYVGLRTGERVVAETLAPLGHDWDEGVETVPASYQAPGLKTVTCTRCGVTDTQETERLANPFVDVAETNYFFDPVMWALDNEVTAGVDDTHFGPNKTCTRAQIVTFLWKACGSPEPTMTENPFTDVPAGKYYYKPVLWAVENDITSGTSATTFGVSKPCTRAQAMTFLWKACDSPEPTTTENPFTDVAEGKYYYKPVLWAVEHGITSGTSATTFGTNKTCTRGQIVTFLYKAFHLNEE